MRVIGLIAVNVFKESVRDKVLYNLVAFAVLLMASTYLLGQLTARAGFLGVYRSSAGRSRSCAWRHRYPAIRS